VTEEVDWVDASDQVVGRVARADVHRLRAGFRVVHVFLFDREGRLLIHQLSPRKRLAGHWGSSVAGGVKAGEAPEEAARREIREEMGIRPPPLRWLGKVRLEDQGATKFLYLYAGVVDAPERVQPNPEEVAAVEFVRVDALRDIVRRRERSFTPTFLTAFALFERGAVA